MPYTLSIRKGKGNSNCFFRKGAGYCPEKNISIFNASGRAMEIENIAHYKKCNNLYGIVAFFFYTIYIEPKEKYLTGKLKKFSSIMMKYISKGVKG